MILHDASVKPWLLGKKINIYLKSDILLCDHISGIIYVSYQVKFRRSSAALLSFVVIFDSVVIHPFVHLWDLPSSGFAALHCPIIYILRQCSQIATMIAAVVLYMLLIVFHLTCRVNGFFHQWLKL